MATNTYQPTPLSVVKSRFDEAVYDPTLLIQAGLETIQDLTNGEAVLLDPTHPAVVILEIGAVEAANALQESVNLLHKQYPILAEESKDLYRHMSDEDYLNRFASPSTTKITFAVLLSDVRSKMAEDTSEGTYRATIPRDTVVSVDGVNFVLNYPVHIRRYNTGAIQIAYDTTIASPIQSVKEVVITPKVRTSTTGEDWLFFDLEMVQVKYQTSTMVIDRIYNFKKTLMFEDQFYFARAFYRNANTNNQWVEMKTTHTDQVFDVRTPTVLFQVNSDTVDAMIPVVYFSSGAISGELRVDVYSTKGELVMNLGNYTQDYFSVALTPIDEVRDYTPFVDAFAGISYYAYGTGFTSGGQGEISFETLRKRVIYNAVGPQNTPITNVALEADAERSAFSIVKEVDVVTNRLFLATRKLPSPSNPKLITPANVGVVTFTGLMSELLASPSVVKHINGRYTLKSNALMKRVNGKTSLLSNTDVQFLRSLNQTLMVAEINNTEYLYNPFYYVLDESGDEFDMRAYALDQPTAANLSFVRINQTLQFFVNTGSYSLSKVSTGYRLVIQTNSGNYFKDAEDSHVGVQLAFNPYGEKTYAYINGVLLGKTEANERVYEFMIETDHDLNENDQIAITNARVQGVDGYKAWIQLDSTFHLLYHTTLSTTNFEADESDRMLGKFILPLGSVGNSHETLEVTLGSALRGLWRRAHSYFNDTIYRHYEEDVPLVYQVDTYDRDPETGLIFKVVNGEVVYNQLHKAGDQIYGEDGEPLYLHRKGDVILDALQQPVTVVNEMVGRELDLLVVDGRYYFADDDATVLYRNEIAKTLTSWIMVDVKALEDALLDQSNIYFYPKTSIGSIEAYYEGSNLIQLSSDQSFQLTLYVEDAIYNNDLIRQDIENKTVKALDSYIDRSVVNMTELRDVLKTLYGTSVKAFTVTGLGGDANYELLSMKDDRYRLSLKKNLAIGADKKMYIKDAVVFDFKKAV